MPMKNIANGINLRNDLLFRNEITLTDVFYFIYANYFDNTKKRNKEDIKK